MSEYESPMNISLNAVLRSNADNPDVPLSLITSKVRARLVVLNALEMSILMITSGSFVSEVLKLLCVLLPLEYLLWAKLRDYTISRVNPNPRQAFLMRVVKK